MTNRGSPARISPGILPRLSPPSLTGPCSTMPPLCCIPVRNWEKMHRRGRKAAPAYSIWSGSVRSVTYVRNWKGEDSGFLSPRAACSPVTATYCGTSPSSAECPIGIFVTAIRTLPVSFPAWLVFCNFSPLPSEAVLSIPGELKEKCHPAILQDGNVKVAAKAFDATILRLSRR